MLDINLIVAGVIVGVIVALLSAGVAGIFSMNSHLSKINGRLGTHEAWQLNHGKQDDERHLELRGWINRQDTLRDRDEDRRIQERQDRRDGGV